MTDLRTQDLGVGAQPHEDREIGSDFELVEDSYLSARRTPELPWEDGSDICYVESGRQALSIVEAELRSQGHTNLTVPSVFCDSMVAAFVAHGWTVTPLPADRDLAVRPAVLTDLVTDGVLLHAPYFGRQDSPAMLEALEALRRRGVVVVVDETHRVFAGASRVADYRVASLRKLLPLYDGGYVAGVRNPPVMGPQVSGSRASSAGAPALRRRAMRAKSAALTSGVGGNAHLSAFSRVERATELATQPVPMSAGSASLLRRLDLEALRSRRESNACVLTEALGDCERYRVTNPPTTDLLPSHLVLETADPVGLRSFLVGRRIYCPIHWPPSRLLTGPRRWPSRYISLPVDHRYDGADMARMGRTIVNHLRSSS